MFEVTYRQRTTIGNEKMERILGHTGTGGERGRIMNPKSFANSLSATDYKDPQKTIKHLTRCEIVAMPLREEKRREESRLMQCRTELAER